MGLIAISYLTPGDSTGKNLYPIFIVPQTLGELVRSVQSAESL